MLKSRPTSVPRSTGPPPCQEMPAGLSTAICFEPEAQVADLMGCQVLPGDYMGIPKNWLALVMQSFGSHPKRSRCRPLDPA